MSHDPIADGHGVSDARILGHPPEAPVLPPQAPWRLLARSPLHWISLGFGSGLSPWAPGTAGTLWAWGSFVLLAPFLQTWHWGPILGVGLVLGWWACTATARALGTADPGAIVWDEILAFWLMLWVLMPAGLSLQVAAFALFRLFDAAKPGPVRWADRHFKGKPGQAPGWAQGFGILFDDLVAALCALLVLALWQW